MFLIKVLTNKYSTEHLYSTINQYLIMDFKGKRGYARLLTLLCRSLKF
jgi:hypothetical protein